MALGAAHDCLLCVVFGVCFVLVCLALFLGVGLGLVWFSGLLYWLWVLADCLWLVGAFCWFCLESLILAQDERWRRA